MRLIVYFILVTSALVVHSIPVETSEEHREPDGMSEKIDTDYVYHAMRSDPEAEELRSMFKIEELVECYKNHGLDPGNLPNVEDISKEGKKIIFNSCNPLFNVPIIALKSKNLDRHLARHWDGRENHIQDKRSESNPTNPLTPRSARMTKRPLNQPHSPSAAVYAPISPASQPIEVRVTFDSVKIVSEVLRLQFLFLNTFFSSLSGCIESEETSKCLLDSFSSAFSVLSIELGDNQ